MYKIYIKRPNTTRILYEPYMTANAIADNPENEESSNELTVYETDDLTVLAEKYKELLADYTTDDIKLVEELNIELLVEVTEN